MPFPQEAGGVSLLAKHLSDSDLADSQTRRMSRKNAESKRKTSGQATASRRRTKRRGRVESVESNSIASHVIQMWRLEIFVAVEADVPPPLIIAHDENDIRGAKRSFIRSHC